MRARSSSEVQISTPCLTIPTNYRKTCKLWPGHPPAPTEARSTLTDSQVDNFHPSPRFARFESIRTRFLPNTTNLGTAGLKCSPSRAPTSSMDRFRYRAVRPSTPNPFVSNESPYYSTIYNGNIGGLINKSIVLL